MSLKDFTLFTGGLIPFPVFFCIVNWITAVLLVEITSPSQKTLVVPV